MSSPVQPVPLQQVTVASYPGSPVIMASVQQPHPASVHKRIFLGLGITEIAIGVLSIILAAVAMRTSIYGYIGSGFWGGAWFILAGALGIASGVRTNGCNVIAGLVITILAALAAFGSLLSESIAASLSSICFTYSQYTHYRCQDVAQSQALHGTLACLAGIAFIVAIVHSAYCCSGCCCRRTSGTTIGNTMAVTTMNTYPGVHTAQIPTQNYGQPQPQYYVHPVSPVSAGAYNYGIIPPESQQPPSYAPLPQKSDFGVAK